MIRKKKKYFFPTIYRKSILSVAYQFHEYQNYECLSGVCTKYTEKKNEHLGSLCSFPP